MVKLECVARDGTVFDVREPAKGDVRDLQSFINSLADEPMSGVLVNKRISLREEEAWLRARMRETRARTAVMLVAEHGGRIVGTCQLSRLPWKHSHRATLGVALRKEVRGKGLGECLIRSTLELGEARMKGLEDVDLSVFTYNDRALSLYLKLGFEEFARIPRSIKEGGRYFDEVMMRLDLRGGRKGRRGGETH